MSPEQFNECKRLIADGMSIRAAAMKVGVSESTLRVALKRDTLPEPPPAALPELQSDSESEPLLPPGIAEVVGRASDLANRHAEEIRQREQDEWLANLRAKRGIQ